MILTLCVLSQLSSMVDYITKIMLNPCSRSLRTVLSLLRGGAVAFDGVAFHLTPGENGEKSLEQLPRFTPRCIPIVQLCKCNKVALPIGP